MRKFAIASLALSFGALTLIAALLSFASAQGGGAYRFSLEPDSQQSATDRTFDSLNRRFEKNSFALVIGIDRFSSSHWRALPGVRNEIDEVRRALEVQGFDIDVESSQSVDDKLLPVSAKQMRDRIAHFLSLHRDKPERRLVIYVASHGYAVTERTGETRGFIVTSDSPASGDDNFQSNAYSVSDLERQLSGVEARHVFLFFNACFSGSMVPAYTKRSEQGNLVKRLQHSVSDWALTLLEHKSRLVLTAGDASQEVPDVNNPFSKAVIDGLLGAADEDGDGIIRGLELASFVTGRVARETHQRGQQNNPIFAKFDDDKGGDYVFVSPRGAKPDKSPVAQLSDLTKMQERLPKKTLFVECRDCPVMVQPPASPEHPQFSFAIAQTETTFNQWDACFRDLYCRSWIDDKGRGRGTNPVFGLTWEDASDFAAWLNMKKADSSEARCKEYRLPTADEWLFAAQANQTTRFPWGDDLGRDNVHCWNCGSKWGRNGPAPTARFPENGFGIYDMVGNLWEWVDDPQFKCEPGEIATKGRCRADGVVMGGAYSTRFAAADTKPLSQKGLVPRTSSQPRKAYRLASVGLRIACTLQPK